MKRSTNQREPNRMRCAWCAIVLAALLVGVAAPSFAARIIQVRVGNHPDFSRVVFELDSHAGYQVQARSRNNGSKVLAVTVDATSRDHEVTSKSLGVGSVRVEEIEGKAVAVVTLRKDNMMMKEMILSNPPRIVLDFESAQPIAAQPRPNPLVPKTQPASLPERVETKTKNEWPPTLSEKPSLVADPEPVAVSKIEPMSPKPVEKRPVDELMETAKAAGEKLDQVAIRAMTPGLHEREGLEATPGVPAMQIAVLPTRPKPALKKTEAPKLRRVVKPVAPSTPSSIDPMMVAAAVCGVLLVAIVAFVFKGRRSIPKNIDVTALSEELADDGEVVDPPQAEVHEATSELDGRIPREGFEMTGAIPGQESADDSESGFAEENTAAYSLGEVSANVDPADPADGMFDDDDSEGEKAMDNDFPAARDSVATAGTPVVESATWAGDSDFAAMVQQLVSRVGALESNLDEANDARERLERQVASQREELRVQRAAIARTQRTLRSLNRSDEEQATEPALRDPS